MRWLKAFNAQLPCKTVILYCNIINMLLVLFALVLILPAFQEGFLSEAYTGADCFKVVKEGGVIFCIIEGYYRRHFTWSPRNCQIGCNGQMVRLPDSVCPQGGFGRCDENAMEKLRRWSDDMKSKKKFFKL
ncbi:uncharacterized protein LOC115326148 [Ixodes scapularis]|uniref:uncharacterized protein LOC115326148 n=1 Tax=Ixodes scapularis TaxID=6945 RepID=UPI001A9F20AF|nr:uncharacterized protein LOC115326148 [Ixodes scapularis]